MDVRHITPPPFLSLDDALCRSPFSMYNINHHLKVLLQAYNYKFLAKWTLYCLPIVNAILLLHTMYHKLRVCKLKQTYFDNKQMFGMTVFHDTWFITTWLTAWNSQVCDHSTYDKLVIKKITVPLELHGPSGYLNVNVQK